MMERKKMVASRGKFRIDNSDGTFTELSFQMPYEIAQEILCLIISWKDNWVATTRTHELYQEVAKEFENIKDGIANDQT